MIFGIVLRPIAEEVDADIAVAVARVVGDAVDDDEMIIGCIDAASDQLHRVARTEPDMKQAPVRGLVAKGADAQTRDRHAMLVGEEAPDRLAEHLAHPVNAVRPWQDRLVDRTGAPIEPDRVMRTRIDDATHALAPRRLEHIP